MTGTAGTGEGITDDEVLEHLRTLRRVSENKAKKRDEPIFRAEVNALNRAMSVVAGAMGKRTLGKIKVRFEKDEIEELIRLIDDEEFLNEKVLDELRIRLQQTLDWHVEAG